MLSPNNRTRGALSIDRSINETFNNSASRQDRYKRRSWKSMDRYGSKGANQSRMLDNSYMQKSINDDTIIMNNTISMKIKDNADMLSKIDTYDKNEPVLAIESLGDQESSDGT